MGVRTLVAALLVAVSRLSRPSQAFLPVSLRQATPLSTTFHPAPPPHYGSRFRPKPTRIVTMAAADFYKDLGVSKSSDEREIKSAFRKRAKTCHPDVDPSALEEWQRVNRAYEVLSDPEQRKRYDMFGEAGLQGAAESGGGGGQQVDLSDLFESFFGGGGGGGGVGFSGFSGFDGGARTKRAKRSPTRGDDLRFDLSVDFSMACFGGEERVKIRHLETCGKCGGDGVKPGSKKRGCGICGGQGAVTQVARTPLGNFQTQSACPTCHGSGEIIDEYCPKCSGQGTVQVTILAREPMPTLLFLFAMANATPLLAGFQAGHFNGAGGRRAGPEAARAGRRRRRPLRRRAR